MAKYCTYCGTKLTEDEESYAIITQHLGYDPETGKERTKVTKYRVVTSGCPNYYNDQAYPETAANCHLHTHYANTMVVQSIPKGAFVFYPSYGYQF